VDYLRRHLPIVLGVVTAILVAAIALAVYDQKSAPQIVIRDPLPPSTIVVEIGGAVATPGVYALPGSARLVDAIDAAGGAKPSADLAQINLAQRIRDEQKITIPVIDSLAESAGDLATPMPSAQQRIVGTAGDRININTATAAELVALPGIGESLAKAIVDDRLVAGPYQSVEDLARVSGISPRMVEEIKDLITV
jgi:competence protein ComEA